MKESLANLDENFKSKAITDLYQIWKKIPQKRRNSAQTGKFHKLAQNSDTHWKTEVLNNEVQQERQGQCGAKRKKKNTEQSLQSHIPCVVFLPLVDFTAAFEELLTSILKCPTSQICSFKELVF